MRLLLLAVFSLFVVGCLEVDAIDGSLFCSTNPDRRCPMGYYCAPNNTCWKNGHPFPGFKDMSVMPFQPADLSGLDLSSSSPRD